MFRLEPFCSVLAEVCGNVAINAWPALSVAVAALPWGGYGGSPGGVTQSGTGSATQSGTGIVHNTCMLGKVDKGVLRAGLRMRPTPPWFSDSSNGGRVAPALVDIVSRPRWRKLPRLVSPMV